MVFAFNSRRVCLHRQSTRVVIIAMKNEKNANALFKRRFRHLRRPRILSFLFLPKTLSYKGLESTRPGKKTFTILEKLFAVEWRSVKREEWHVDQTHQLCAASFICHVTNMHLPSWQLSPDQPIIHWHVELTHRPFPEHWSGQSSKKKIIIIITIIIIKEKTSLILKRKQVKKNKNLVFLNF